MIAGLGNLTVKVNGQSTRLDGAVFTSQAIELEEGNNLIKIEVFSGTTNNTAIIEKEITVVKDTTVPVRYYSTCRFHTSSRSS